VFAAESDVRALLRSFHELVDLRLNNVCCLKKLLENKIAINSTLKDSVFEGIDWANEMEAKIILNKLRTRGTRTVERQEGNSFLPR